MLFAKIRAQDKTLDALKQYQRAFDDRWRRSESAVERGLLANDAVTPFLVALQDVNRQVNDVVRQLNQSRHDLAVLVGVSPDVELKLVDDGAPVRIDRVPVRAALTSLLMKRPDLAALRAGYEAEDDRYRGALIAQFPGFTFGPTRSRDTSNVNTAGIALGITLPIFNRNRGNIAIEEATRDKLRIEFQNRLDATTVEVDRLFVEQDLLERQIAQVDNALNDLMVVSRRAENAFAASNVDALVITNAQTALLAKEIERITSEELLAEQRIALHTLIANDLSSSTSPTRSGPSMKRSHRVTVVVAIALLALLGWFGWRLMRSSPAASPAAPQPALVAPVTTAKIERTMLTRRITTYGEIAAGMTLGVSFARADRSPAGHPGCLVRKGRCWLR